jgi:hypothetical protein
MFGPTACLEGNAEHTLEQSNFGRAKLDFSRFGRYFRRVGI